MQSLGMEFQEMNSCLKMLSIACAFRCNVNAFAGSSGKENSRSRRRCMELGVLVFPSKEVEVYKDTTVGVGRDC